MRQQYLFQALVEAIQTRRESERDNDAPPRKWYRFTLWKMVVAFMLMGVALAYVRNTHWGYITGERIGDIGRKFGWVEKPDASKVRVTAVRPFGILDCEWRISVPKGYQYETKIEYWGGTTGGHLTVPDESLVSFSFQETSNLVDRLQCRVLNAEGNFPRLYRSHREWAPPGTASSYARREYSGVLWGEGEQTFIPGQPILLYSSDIVDEQGAWGTRYKCGQEFAIWLEPVPANGP